MLPSDGWVSSTLQKVQQWGTQASLAGARFSLDEADYQRTYNELYAAYRALAEERTAIEAQAGELLCRIVSYEIQGIAAAGEAARRVVGGQGSPSMTMGMSATETSLKKALVAMADAWSAYQRADYEAMTTLLRAVNA